MAITIKVRPQITPGRKPAMNMVLMEAPVDTPYITIGMLGGMIVPRHPEAATRAMDHLFS